MNMVLIFFQSFLTVVLVLSACADPPPVTRSNSKATSEEPATNLSDEELKKIYLSFDSTLKPLVLVACGSCHAQLDRGIGPNTIYQAAAMANLAKVGKSSLDNKLINKLLNKISHGGGSQCIAIDKSPCVEFVTWAKQLYRAKVNNPGTATNDPTKTDPHAGRSSGSNSTGGNSVPSTQPSTVDTGATNLAALEQEYNAGLKNVIDASCNGSGCHSTRESKLTTFQGVKSHASDSLQRINNGNMPLNRKLSDTDKASLTSFLNKLSR